MVRNDNTSSRYAMEAGGEYVLFLARDGGAFRVDSCGNSAARDEAGGLAGKIRRLLRTAEQAGS